MKGLFCPVLAMVLLAGAYAPAAPMNDGMHSTPASTKGVELCGKLSDDGKTFVADDDNQWRVTNAEVLKGREGRYLTVRCRMDVSKRAIRVLSIQQTPEATNAARLGDAAFRR